MNKNKIITSTLPQLTLLALLLAGHLPARGAGMPTLEVIEVRAGAQDLIGVADAASVGTVTARQLETRPLLRPAEALET
ncbi:MAG TPA: hypothetical protein VFK74_06755, partial [Azospira sp.]|nr:hypothetical protein [Azospira sp.]